MIATERLYPIRRPMAAACAGAAVAILGGLIGLGGAEFRLPILIGIFALFPHRAVRTNLLISLATLAMSAVARLSFVHTTSVADFKIEIVGMLVGGIIAAWLGAGYLRSVPKSRMMGVIAALLLVTAVLLATETPFSGVAWSVLASGSAWTLPVAIVAGMLVGAISSLLGVAGGEFIIPILIFIFGADIHTAGTASVLISIPVVLTGVARHWLTGHYRSQSLLVYLVLPMAIGSGVGAMVGGYLAAWAPTDALRITLAIILAMSAIKLWSKGNAH
ncbi:MAG: sulfite exporter TauE/SafE family protein [Hyphomonadaceae bacterium]|nr:sulfite exporter TauE/SafE family protein [Hyphomonadaceae bacterium]